MGSALLNPAIADSTLAEAAGEAAAPSALASSSTAQELRHQVAERLAAHRNRRGGTAPASAPRATSAQTANTRAARIAAAVAERYAHTQSYRAFLAAEAERAVQQARAAAEIAAMNAQAVAQAQQQLLDSLAQAVSDAAGGDGAEAGDPAETEATPNPEPTSRLEGKWVAPQPAVREQSLWPELDAEVSRVPRQHRHRAASEPRSTASASNPEPRTSDLLTVRLYEDAATAAHVELAATHRAATGVHANRGVELNEAEAFALDEEIAFRQAPVFEEPAGPPISLPANLIEFPRQLVASRKARPRYAEGPLRDEADAPIAGDGQLRIFEVDPAQISTQPDSAEPAAEIAAPQWTSIWLDAPAASDFALPAGSDAGITNLPETWVQGQPQSSDAGVRRAAAAFPDAASIGLRAKAAAMNAAILFAALLAFAAVFVAIAGHWQPGTPLGTVVARTGLPLNLVPGAAAFAIAILYLVYQALFFSLSDSTPGMRLARIALCTFEDENPSRRAMRRRLFAVVLSVIPFGLGLLWAALDEDRLTWHDRIARMYQRSY
jgi:uncharacterized RDD family membrane protein YckC